MSDSYGTYDGRVPEPPYETDRIRELEGAMSNCPKCGDGRYFEPDGCEICQYLDRIRELEAENAKLCDENTIMRESLKLARIQNEENAELREALQKSIETTEVLLKEKRWAIEKWESESKGGE